MLKRLIIVIMFFAIGVFQAAFADGNIVAILVALRQQESFQDIYYVEEYNPKNGEMVKKYYVNNTFDIIEEYNPKTGEMLKKYYVNNTFDIIEEYNPKTGEMLKKYYLN